MLARRSPPSTITTTILQRVLIRFFRSGDTAGVNRRKLVCVWRAWRKGKGNVPLLLEWLTDRCACCNTYIHRKKKQIETEKESAIRDIRRQVALLSVGVAEKVIRTKLADDKEQTELISRLVDEMVESSK